MRKQFVFLFNIIIGLLFSFSALAVTDENLDLSVNIDSNLVFEKLDKVNDACEKELENPDTASKKDGCCSFQKEINSYLKEKNLVYVLRLKSEKCKIE